MKAIYIWLTILSAAVIWLYLIVYKLWWIYKQIFSDDDLEEMDKGDKL